MPVEAARHSAGPGGRTPLGRALKRPAPWAALALVAVLAAIRLAWPAARFGPSLAVELLVAGAMAMAMATVVIGGGIDLSGGAVMALAGGIAAACVHAGLAWWSALAAGLAGGAAFGLASGWLVAVERLPPAMTTLGSFAAAAATAATLRGDLAGTAAPLGHPLRLLAALAAVMVTALSLTVWGRHVYAIGGNAVAARAHGVKVARVTVETYIASAVLASLAGVALLGEPSLPAPGLGDTLQAVAAAVIGGVSLSGGEGGIGGALLGAALLVAVRHALLLAGLDAGLVGGVSGLCIFVAVARTRQRPR